MRKIFDSIYFRSFFLLLTGVLLGWILFHSPATKPDKQDPINETTQLSVWTCAMHPQIRMESPGKCPICAMDLVQLNQNSSSPGDPDAIHLTPEAAQLANVSTTIVTKGEIIKEIRLYGKVQADERLRQNQVAHIPGRIEKLLVNFTGESVHKGQKLALIYSPELVTAQQELLEASKSKVSQPELYEASKEKLQQWKLTEKQIQSIENSGQIQSHIEVTSDTEGYVTAKRVNTGDYVSQGSVLYEIADLRTVWLLFDAFESDLPFLQIGDKVDFTLQSMPETAYSGTIKFIDPVMDPVNRVAKIRVETGNPGARLKPEMFATGVVQANLKAYEDHLVVPRSAVLWTGKRSVVYVKTPGKTIAFKLREVGLGPLIGNRYVINDGLLEGEEIVTEGTFSVDAAAQLEGKPSMMNSTIEDEKSGLKEFSLKVRGNCEMCRERIEKAAKFIATVKRAHWSSETQLLTIQVDPSVTSTDEIMQLIAKNGHDTEKYKAPDEVYKQLPECCLYRK